MVLKNLFGKKSEYFLEFEEAKGTGSATTAPKTEPAAPAETPAPVAPAVAETPATPVKSKKAEKASAPKAAAPKAPAPKAKKSESAPAPAKPAPAPAPAQPAAPVGGFATEYLMPSPTPRRRPGPNMKTFLDMASQMRNK